MEGNLKEKLRTKDSRRGFYTQEAKGVKGGWEIHPVDPADRRGPIGEWRRGGVEGARF